MSSALDRNLSDRGNEVQAVDDSTLLDLARQGTDDAIRILVQKHNRLLFRLARGFVQDDAEAEDIVQETYLRAFAKLEAFRGEAAFSTWLSRIAINEALGRIRKYRPVAPLEEVEFDTTDLNGNNVVMFPIAPSTLNPETETARKQVRSILERAVDTLPEIYKAVFILRDVEGLSTQETGTHLSIKSDTVKTRLHRARGLMKKAVEQELSAGFSEIFPFDGERCAGMVDRVVGLLKDRRQT